jgi:3D (Asp-Asp-Asp) domain-containing protein
MNARPAFVLAAALTMLVASSTGASRHEVRPGSEASFLATAYCDSGITKSGVRTRSGIIAADPALLPVGSVVVVYDVGHRRYEGIYTVMDTGGLVKGRRIDVYIPSCQEAKEFGLRKDVTVHVLRLGWNPRASANLASLTGQ